MIAANLKPCFYYSTLHDVTSGVWHATGGWLGGNWCTATSVMDGQGKELCTVSLFNSLHHIRSSSTI